MINKLRVYILGFFRTVFNVSDVTIQGIKVNLNHSSITKALRKVFYYELYEADEISILKNHLVKQDVLLEIGAGIGYLSSYCSKIVGDERVYSYEANPEMAEKVSETYKLNNVSPNFKNAFASFENSFVDFYLESNFWSSSSKKRSENSKKVSIPTIDINEEINRVSPTFMIVDIEGGEIDLIDKINFTSVKKLILEVHPHVIGDGNTSKVIAQLVSKGFDLMLTESRGIVLYFEKKQSNEA